MRRMGRGPLGRRPGWLLACICFLKLSLGVSGTSRGNSTGLQPCPLEATSQLLSCDCGLGQVGRMVDLEGQHQQRIVNGYEPLVRPWLVFIQLKQNEYSRARCAGTLVNKLWVLSAAHCFCTSPLNCVRRRIKASTGAQALVTDYKPRDMVMVILGIKDLTVATLRAFSHTRYEVSKVVLHPGYQPTISSNRHRSNDIALVKLAREATFESAANKFFY